MLMPKALTVLAAKQLEICDWNRTLQLNPNLVMR